MDQVVPGTVIHLWEIKNNLIGQFKQGFSPTI